MSRRESQSLRTYGMAHHYFKLCCIFEMEQLVLYIVNGHGNFILGP